MLGAATGGLTGNFLPLGIKAVMDGMAAMSFVAMFGGSVALAALPSVVGGLVDRKARQRAGDGNLGIQGEIGSGGIDDLELVDAWFGPGGAGDGHADIAGPNGRKSIGVEGVRDGWAEAGFKGSDRRLDGCAFSLERLELRLVLG